MKTLKADPVLHGSSAIIAVACVLWLARAGYGFGHWLFTVTH